MPPSSGMLTVMRCDGASIDVGQFVLYRFKEAPFQVAASRYGVEIGGKLPLMPPDSLNNILILLRRAQAHARHLATFAVGTPQTVLTEEDITAALTQESAPPPMVTLTDGPTNGSTPRTLKLVGAK